jgi:hypothetical protein
MRHATDDSHDRGLAWCSPDNPAIQLRVIGLVAVGVAVLFALLAAGCGSSNPKALPPGPTTTTPATGATTSGTVLTTPPPTSVSVLSSPPTTAAPIPTLGSLTSLINGQGFGKVEPNKVFLGGDPTGILNAITWQTWGGQEATGTGTGFWVRPGGFVVGAIPEPASIVAYDLGTCGGEYMYRSVEWFFPQQGQTFDPSLAWDLCKAYPEALRHPTTSAGFVSPSANISCDLSYGEPGAPLGEAYCQTLSPPQSVTMTTAGTYKTCGGIGCLGNPGVGTPTLGYGYSVTVGPFRCQSETDGMTCTASGVGFRISRTGIIPATQ